jgi:hypothetical protein
MQRKNPLYTHEETFFPKKVSRVLGDLRFLRELPCVEGNLLPWKEDVTVHLFRAGAKRKARSGLLCGAMVRNRRKPRIWRCSHRATGREKSGSEQRT